MKVIYFAGGCFWGMEHFFRGIDGVLNVVPGYANGAGENPSYEEVYTDSTGFAETVKVEYSAEQTTLKSLVELYFTVIDPCSINRQGSDVGTRYRTGIYYVSDADLPEIESVCISVEARLTTPMQVEVQPLRNFYPAEERHRRYLDKNPGGYCHIPLKSFSYLRLYQDIRNLISGETDIVARMANVAAMIHWKFRFWWTGFYIVRNGELVLGPFQGPVACMRIGCGRGVCGTAWQEERTIVVPDVDDFPGHIACSSESRSEIVVPLFLDGQVVAVLDIDSEVPATFDATDALWLEKIAKLIF